MRARFGVEVLAGGRTTMNRTFLWVTMNRAVCAARSIPVAGAVLAAWSVVVGLGTARGDDLVIRHPRPHEVVQRVAYKPREAHVHGTAKEGAANPARGHADVRVDWTPLAGGDPSSGAPSSLDKGTVEARVVALEGAYGVGSDWAPLKRTEGVPTAGTLRVAAGGWYRLEVRVMEQEKIVASGSVEPFGVGEVFVIAGQSYATNTNDEMLKVTEPLARVTVHDWKTGDWRVAHDPQPAPDDSDGGSIWPVLGDMLVPLIECPVGFVNVAWGGTSSAQWMPGEPLHKRLVEVGGRVGGFRAVLWQQGESDVIGKTTVETYVANLTAIREKAATAWGRSPPWLLAKSTLHPTVYNDPEGEGRIRAAIDLLVKQPGFGRGPDTDILGGANRGPMKSRRHFSPVGQRRAAHLWFASIWRELEAGE